MVRVSPLLLVLLAAGPGLLLPLPAEDGRGDTQVRKCIVEVISDTLSKPSPLPISQECLETLRGDKRIVSILRHQNLLKELQEIAIEGANERNQQQKKNSGFEDELSEVLESQNDNMQRDKGKEIPAEEAAASLAELEAEKMQHNERENSKEDEKNSLEEREPRPRDVDPEDKENAEEFESNEIGEAEESPREDALDNHIGDDLSEDEVSEQKHQEGEDQPAGTNESLELEEAREKVSKKDQEESKEEKAVEEHAEKDGDRRDTPRDEQPTETEGLFGSNEDESEEIQREDNNEDALGFGKGGRSSEEEEKSFQMKGGRHHSEDEAMQAEDTYDTREVKSEEMEESSKEWGDSKRWNKMDELAKQLTTKKRMEENDSGEDPDRSMKMSLRSRKYDFNSPEEDVRRSWNHHSKEDSSEGFPLAPMPEEKKDEEGSANRRTEDQELESLAAIEAELEKVAHKLHELRRG